MRPIIHNLYIVAANSEKHIANTSSQKEQPRAVPLEGVMLM